jgi:predicted enzyme related to lactoylglutathione lyase
MGAPVIQWEITSKNAGELQKFYSGLFDWKVDTNNPLGYGLVDTQNERGAAGGIGEPPPGDDGHLTFYVMVDDPQATLDKVEAMGGKTVMPPSEIPGAGVTIAMFTDPQGHLIGLTKS